MFNRFSFLAAVVKIYRCSVILSYYEWYYIVDRKSIDYTLLLTIISSLNSLNTAISSIDIAPMFRKQ